MQTAQTVSGRKVTIITTTGNTVWTDRGPVHTTKILWSTAK